MVRLLFVFIAGCSQQVCVRSHPEQVTRQATRRECHSVDDTHNEYFQGRLVGVRRSTKQECTGYDSPGGVFVEHVCDEWQTKTRAQTKEEERREARLQVALREWGEAHAAWAEVPEWLACNHDSDCPAGTSCFMGEPWESRQMDHRCSRGPFPPATKCAASENLIYVVNYTKFVCGDAVCTNHSQCRQEGTACTTVHPDLFHPEKRCTFVPGADRSSCKQVRRIPQDEQEFRVCTTKNPKKGPEPRWVD